MSRSLGVSMRLLPLFLLFAAPALGQIESREGIALQNQILELRQELQQLQSQGGAPVAAPVQPAAPQPGGQSDVAADLVVRVTALEEQVRTLQGRVDELTNQLQKQHDDLSKQISDLAFKLGQGGGAAAAAPAAGGEDGGVQAVPAAGDETAPAAPAPAPAPVPVRRTPELALKQGNAALARRDYAAAAAMANEVISSEHAGPRANDAEFLLARAQYGQHQFQAAAAQFYKVYTHNPRSNRGAESLLGVSNALLELGDSKDACEAVAKLQVEFPRAEGGVKAGAASVRKRAKCR